jgi:hypothetical protein
MKGVSRLISVRYWRMLMIGLTIRLSMMMMMNFRND